MADTSVTLPALAELFRDMVRGGRRASPNIAGLVWISAAAWRCYDERVARLLARSEEPALEVRTFAHMLTGGALLILATCDTGECLLTVRPGQWGWRRPPS